MISTWDSRRRIGGDHEQVVADRLRQQDWIVQPWGMDTLHPTSRALIHACGSPAAHLPDLMAAPRSQPHKVVLIDCKAQSVAGETERAIATGCVFAQLRLSGTLELPLWYVFSDLAVSSPQDVIHSGRLVPAGPNSGSGDMHFRVPRTLDREFDSVFATAARYVQMQIAA